MSMPSEQPIPGNQENLTAQVRADELLIRLFRRHFADPVAALRRLDAHLASAQLPFELKEQVRELPFPPQPGMPDGMPSCIYYFVPGSRRGSDQPVRRDPLHPSFVNSCDGIGLNLGCPVRLLRAMDALAQLPPGDRRSPLAGLCNPPEHLNAVEELLWLTGWRSPSSMRRGGQFAGLRGDVDWFLEIAGYPVFVEAKFRRSDWPRLTDGMDFVRMGDGFLSSAAHKFPDPPHTAAIHVVGITTFTNITEEIAHLVGTELEAAPQIHAVVVRSLLQMTHVISLSVEIRDRVLGLLAVPSIREFPVNHSVFFHRQQREERVVQRPKAPTSAGASKAVCWSIQPQGSVPFPMPEPGLYRLSIPSRGSDGEPHFQVIPKYLMPSTA